MITDEIYNEPGLDITTEQTYGYYFITVLASLFIILSINLWICQLTAIIYSLFYFHKNKIEALPNEPGVTILKPLKFSSTGNYDLACLQSNLETFFNLSYKRYEIIFCVHDTDDLSIDIVNKLIKSHPHIKAKLLVGGEEIGVNPKINNMQKGYVASNSTYKYLWICDAGIRVNKDVLMEMVSLIVKDESIGLVHQLPFTYDLNRKSQLGNVIEKIYFGSQHGRVQICAHLLGQVCITGMSNLIRKTALEKSSGGLIGLSSYIAEDYFMTKKMEAAGYKFRLSSFPALQNQTHVTIKSFFGRMSRWTKLRITMLPGVTCIEPFSEIFLSSFITSFAVNWWFPQVPGMLFYSFNIFFWFITDMLLMSVLNNKIPNVAFTKLLLCWLLRENSTIVILLSALFNNKTKWHNGSFRIGFGGKAEEVSEHVNSLS